MNNLKIIRKKLGITQAELAKLIGCTQGNIGHYENKKQTIKPEVAQRIVSVARERGLNITYEDIYVEARMKEVKIVKEVKPNIQVLGDAFGGTYILLDGKVFITMNYLSPWIDNAGMRSLANDIVKLISGTSAAQED
jgi:putative transcriptional regulator